MHEHYEIATPENVSFAYEIAGLGSRMLAAAIDHVILIVAYLLLFCGALTLVGSFGSI
jgi:uncharacterized RDD family membrane protein YckC